MWKTFGTKFKNYFNKGKTNKGIIKEKRMKFRLTSELKIRKKCNLGNPRHSVCLKGQMQHLKKNMQRGIRRGLRSKEKISTNVAFGL